MTDCIDLLGIPFKEGGRDLSGLDCWGLCMEIYRRAGKMLPDFQSPSDKKTINKMIQENKDLAERIPNPEPLCLVLFRLCYPLATHIGVVLDDCVRFIHTSKKRNVVIDRLDQIIWRNLREGFYRWIE